MYDTQLKIAFSRNATSPPALLTALTAASLNLFLLSLASASLLARVFELPLGATSLSSLALSLGVKLTKSKLELPFVGVFGVLGVRGGFEELLVSLSLMGPALWIDLRRLWL